MLVIIVVIRCEFGLLGRSGLRSWWLCWLSPLIVCRVLCGGFGWLFLGVLVSGCCGLIVVRELVCVMLAVALVDGCMVVLVLSLVSCGSCLVCFGYFTICFGFLSLLSLWRD